MIDSKPRKTKEYFNKYLYFKRVGAYMKVYDSNMLRNIAVLGHSGCGKTNLIEAINGDSQPTMTLAM